MRNAIVYNPDLSARTPILNRLAILLAAVRPLHRRHAVVSRHCRDPGRAKALTSSLDSLSLALAFLESALAPVDRPPQIAVIGPTQAGKSTVVNALLGEDRAGVSPLAGYTVHPQGFPVHLPDAALAWLDDYFAGYARYTPGRLPSDRYDAYALADTLHGANHALPACVLWDTPDFDSVDALTYRAGVLRTAALADALLVVMSKDKYADQSVWDTLALLEPLGQPTVLCLNKTPSDVRDTLVRSLGEKWRTLRSDAPPPVIVLPYLDHDDGAERDAWNAGAARLRSVLTEAVHGASRASAEQRAMRLLRRHWDAWLAPVRAERRVLEEWRSLIDSALNEAVTLYARDYLDRSRHYETFQRALAELLALLEIPGLAGVLLAARKVVTWPVRQLTRLGSGRARGGSDPEAEILLHIIDHVFIRLGDTALDHAADPLAPADWWRDLGRLLRETRPRTAKRAGAAIATYRQEFQPEIERTARQLYERLREHPAILNSLRATRVTTDAAALAAALHTGGLGIQDFILAPAMLSLTSLLAESALGRYLHKAELELKTRQREQVGALLERILRDTLSTLPEALPDQERFNLAPASLASAEALLGVSEG
jgi:GTPase SAR1 family protein